MKDHGPSFWKRLNSGRWRTSSRSGDLDGHDHSYDCRSSTVSSNYSSTSTSSSGSSGPQYGNNSFHRGNGSSDGTRSSHHGQKAGMDKERKQKKRYKGVCTTPTFDFTFEAKVPKLDFFTTTLLKDLDPGLQSTSRTTVVLPDTVLQSSVIRGAGTVTELDFQAEMAAAVEVSLP
ncbi:MAG: hypothetical protein Q9164_004137, partial [Protoblastenia rupestris]